VRLVHAGVLDDGGGQEQKGRNLVEGESVLVSGRGLSFRRFGLDLFSLDGHRCAHSRANITRRASRQAIRPAMAARRHRWTETFPPPRLEGMGLSPSPGQMENQEDHPRAPASRLAGDGRMRDPHDLSRARSRPEGQPHGPANAPEDARAAQHDGR